VRRLHSTKDRNLLWDFFNKIVGGRQRSLDMGSVIWGWDCLDASCPNAFPDVPWLGQLLMWYFLVGEWGAPFEGGGQAGSVSFA